MFEARQSIVTGLTVRPPGHSMSFDPWWSVHLTLLSCLYVRSNVRGLAGCYLLSVKLIPNKLWRRLVTGNEEWRRSEMSATPRPGFERVNPLGCASHTSSQRPIQRHWRCRGADDWSECSSDDERVVCHVVSGLGCSLVELTSM